MAFHQVLAEWSQWFWPLAINHFWQATLFALLVWASMRLLRQASPQMRWTAWWLALAKFLLPVAWLTFALDKLGLPFSHAESWAADFSTSALILFETAEPVAEVNALVAQNAAHSEVYCVLTLVWLSGVIAVWVNWQTRRWRLGHALRAESASATGRAAELFAELQTRLGFSHRIPLIVAARIAEPGVLGIWRPKVVLPPGLDEQLGDDELAAILMHELFHVRQRDNLLSSARMIVCGLAWFHPLVWLIDRMLMDECELMCDEKVIRYGSAAECYAAGLWKVVQHGLGWPVAGVSRVTGSNLKRRIELMLKTDYLHKPTLRQRALPGLTVAVLVALTFAVSVLPRTDAQAQNQESKPSDNSLIDVGQTAGVRGGVAGGVAEGVAGGMNGGIAGGKATGVSENGFTQRQDGERTKKTLKPVVIYKSRASRPKILYKEKAQYTKEARDKKIEGTVVLNMLFGADAKITNIKVVRGLPDGLTEAAIEAAKKIRFEPAVKDGQPVSVRGNIEYSFRLKE